MAFLARPTKRTCLQTEINILSAIRRAVKRPMAGCAGASLPAHCTAASAPPELPWPIVLAGIARTGLRLQAVAAESWYNCSTWAVGNQRLAPRTGCGRPVLTPTTAVWAGACREAVFKPAGTAAAQCMRPGPVAAAASTVQIFKSVPSRVQACESCVPCTQRATVHKRANACKVCATGVHFQFSYSVPAPVCDLARSLAQLHLETPVATMPDIAVR